MLCTCHSVAYLLCLPAHVPCMLFTPDHSLLRGKKSVMAWRYRFMCDSYLVTLTNTSFVSHPSAAEKLHHPSVPVVSKPAQFGSGIAMQYHCRCTATSYCEHSSSRWYVGTCIHVLSYAWVTVLLNMVWHLPTGAGSHCAGSCAGHCATSAEEEGGSGACH